MNSICYRWLKSHLLLPLVATLFFAATSFAQPTSTGTIQGRVVSERNGEYLANSRVTVEGTALESFTDSDGFYRLTNVPAGAARVTTFFTGFGSHTTNVTVAAGQVAQHDIKLGSATTRAATSTPGVVKLDEFVVATSREMDAAALAINEQRFASNIKDVVSTEEFGNVAEGNAAEFLKFLPGVEGTVRT